MNVLSWYTLFLGAFLDALIGPNLIVPGEPFLIAAGYQLHQGSYTGLFAVLIAGWLGDQSSFFIGRRFGIYIQRKLIVWQPWLNRYFARTRLLMRQNGSRILLLARLLGPVAWVVPFIAGMQQVSWQRFSFFGGLGLLIGVGQFVFLGYLIAQGIDSIPWLAKMNNYLDKNTPLSLGIIFSTVGIFFIFQCLRRKRLSNIDK